MNFDLANKVGLFLGDNPEKEFTAKDIAIWIFENFEEECRAKQARSKAAVRPLDTDEALINQIATEIAGSRRTAILANFPKIKTIEGPKRKFIFTEVPDGSEMDLTNRETTLTQPSETDSAISEKDLYPKLSDFLWSEFEVYSIRIDERRSSKKGGAGANTWLFPDIVGMKDLSRDWIPDVNQCVQEYSNSKTILWSFEVKKKIDRSNVRQFFFQAVSNSSWANYGYLVASEIRGQDTMKELRILAGLHGIGVIRLDLENSSESQIIIPAKERIDVDWDSANRLAQENKDFLKFITLIRQFYQTGDIQAGWDTQFDVE